MKSVNSLSAGETSSYMAVHFPADYDVFSVVCIDDTRCKPSDPAVIEYANRKLEKYSTQYGEFIATAEDDKSLVVMMDLEQIIGREITWVRGQSFDYIIRNKSIFGGEPSRLPHRISRYCTTIMKMQAIFEWWWNNIYEKVDMRIGFRIDEFKRMERFFNNSNPTQFSIPISCSTQGQRLQKNQTFKWRYCSFPLVENMVTKFDVKKYWRENGWIQADLFQERRQIKFPAISNCVGCFHKNPETLATMWEMHPAKMTWFAEQEKIGKGTWLDTGQTYFQIGENRYEIAKEVMYEIMEMGESCDSGGCTD